MIAACAGSTARKKALVPAVQSAWTGIAKDASGHDPTELATFDAAIKSGDIAALKTVTQLWPGIQASALSGIDARVTAGEISEGVALSLRERIKNFNEAFLKVVR